MEEATRARLARYYKDMPPKDADIDTIPASFLVPENAQK